MKFLFFLHDTPWPIRGGQQLHTYNMIKALVALGHDVHMVASEDISAFPPDKHQGWSVSMLSEADGHVSENQQADLKMRIAGRWMRYWGIPSWALAAIRQSIQEYNPDVVVLVGLQALPLSVATGDVPTIWYAADDWVLHHATLAMKGSFKDRLHSIKNAFMSFAYERSFSAQLDGAIAVSRKDQKALRWAGGVKNVVLAPNGVDSELFYPSEEQVPAKPSLCFWGRMDFQPNIDAMVWFCREIWPGLLEHFPNAEMTVVGANPVPVVLELESIRNVTVTGEVDDVRPYAWQAQVVVMPMRIGGGIKNKLLEACSMGKPIVVSPLAVEGLEIGDASNKPWIICHSKKDWIDNICRLWKSENDRSVLGHSTRNYALEKHSWLQTAEKLVKFVGDMK